MNFAATDHKIFPIRAGGRVLLALALFGLGTAIAARADQAEDLRKKAKTVGNEDAVNLLCQASDLKPNDKKYKEDCQQARNELNADFERFNNYYKSGMSLLDNHRFDEARAKFEKIHFGPHFQEAQQLLGVGIEAKRKEYQAQASAPPQPAAPKQEDTSFRDGSTAFGNGNYGAASSLLSKVPADSPDKAKAVEELRIIADYNGKMKEADQYASQKSYDNAKRSYLEASRVGSGGAAAQAITRANEMNDLIEATKRPVPSPSTERSAPGPVSAATTRRPTEQQLAARPTTTPAPGNLDAFLSDGIGNFYKGDVESIRQAESLLQDYLKASGPKQGLAYFFLGASNMAHYYLLDPKATDKRVDLQRQALENFKKARRVEGFVPPEQYVTPKILDEYRKAG